ncbi:hypothetical protein NicSoilC12_27050 [Arthrobacter sp. NicSoilC12]|nr:hypothetical protein NicSoilC12_27050 [Arthrobacter sp. NicSoilC12]
MAHRAPPGPLAAAPGAADGFNIMPPVLPSGLDAFVDHVIPILRDRGLFRRAYSGRTLREHYGLPRPDNTFVSAAPRSPPVSGPAGSQDPTPVPVDEFPGLRSA